MARRLQRALALQMNISRVLVTAVATCVFAAACSSNKPANSPGPAEEAGAKVDEGAADVKESAQEAGHKVGETTEKAGEKIQTKTGD